MAHARVVTINMWGDRAPWPGRAHVAARQLLARVPDVILVQEARRGEGLPCTAETLATALGPEWTSHFGSATTGPAGTWGPGTGAGEEGLAILSRHPVDDLRVAELPEARSLDRRILLSARVDVAGHLLHVHTTHLHWRLGDGLAREQQVVAVDELARAFGQGVHVIGGDFNAAPATDEIRFMRGETTLAGRRAVWQDAFLRVHPDAHGWTWASANPHTDWLAHLARDRRIDYLFVSPEQRGGAGQVLDCQVVLDQPGEEGLLASDHYGLIADIQLA
jgi:endonuclease/exonuclease/phosphatase family metal-dependent hydrolase